MEHQLLHLASLIRRLIRHSSVVVAVILVELFCT
nr:MAG TPA: hypothetical protein [Caudoviricetes sp.]